MTTEKQWWMNNYAEDIHKHLRCKERKRFLFRGQSPQLYIRKKLVSFIDEVCEKLEYCTTVQHLAIYLLDIFMDNHIIQEKHLEMVALECLVVAAKLEEQDKPIPKFSECMILLVNNKYQISEFVQMEVSILKFFQWTILFPTAANFTEYYLLYCVFPTDLLNDKPVSCYDDVDVYVKKYIEYFLDVVLRDHEYLGFSPSLVAAACIASTRRCMLIKPLWPEALQNVTFYSYSQLQPCVDLLLRVLDEDMLKQSKVSKKKPQKSCASAKRKISLVDNSTDKKKFKS